jgi:hypothetical protein
MKSVFERNGLYHLFSELSCFPPILQVQIWLILVSFFLKLSLLWHSAYKNKIVQRCNAFLLSVHHHDTMRMSIIFIHILPYRYRNVRDTHMSDTLMAQVLYTNFTDSGILIMGVRLTSHWTAAAFTGLLFLPGWEWMNGWMSEKYFFLIYEKVEPTVEWYWHGKTEELGEKPVPVPLCPPQIPLDWPGPPRWEAGD